MNIASAPAPGPKPAPAPVPPAPTNLTTFRLGWDDSPTSRTTAVWTTFQPTPDGAKMKDAGVTISWGQDTHMNKADATQQLIAQHFVDMINQRDGALRQLQSNYDGAAWNLKAGQFELIIDRPGTDADLHYVGLLAAMPAPVRDLLVSAREMRTHL